jgi:hypothetical protein
MTRRHTLWPYLVLLAEVLAFFHKIVFSSRYLIPWDLQFYHQPLAWFASRSLARGELPLWDPYSYCGMPVYANLTTQLFYPPTVAVFLASNWIGAGRHLLYFLEVQIVAHVLLAGVFTLLLLRRIGTSDAGALVGATIYQLSAYFASQTQHLGAIDAAAWLPLAWLATVELGERFRRRWLATLAATLALSFLAGFPAATAVVYGSTALLALILVVFRRARWSLAAWCAAAFLWSALLSSVQLFPTMELSRQSVASLRADFLNSGGGVPVGALITMVLPNRYGVFQYEGAKWTLPWNPTFLYLYCGIPALLFTALALARRRNRFTAVFGVMALASALWMLGGNTPVYRAVFGVLPDRLKAALYSEFAMCAFTLALALLAGLGAHEFLQARGRLMRGAVVLLTAIDLVAFSSGRPMNTSDASREPGVSYGHYDRFPQIPARMRQLVNEAAPPWRVDTMKGSLLWSSCANLFEVPTASGDDPFALVRYMQVRESFTGGERWGRYYEVRDPHSPVLKLLNVRFVISNGALAEPGGLVKREDLPGNAVYENTDPLPRFFVVGKLRQAGSMDDAVALLRSPGFNLRAEAVVEGAAASAEATGTVRVMRYGSSEVELETDAPARAFLVSSEAWYPGWRAEIDGREQPLVLTNAAFRGLEVPGGRHKVTMRFRPAILWRSALISGVALVLLIAVCIRDNGGRNGWEQRAWTS